MVPQTDFFEKLQFNVSERNIDHQLYSFVGSPNAATTATRITALL